MMISIGAAAGVAGAAAGAAGTTAGAAGAAAGAAGGKQIFRLSFELLAFQINSRIND